MAIHSNKGYLNAVPLEIAYCTVLTSPFIMMGDDAMPQWRWWHRHCDLVLGDYIRVMWPHALNHQSETNMKAVCAVWIHWTKGWVMHQTRWVRQVWECFTLLRTVHNLRLVNYLFGEFSFNIFRLETAAGNWDHVLQNYQWDRIFYKQ
jgi:hypothetical protein